MALGGRALTDSLSSEESDARSSSTSQATYRSAVRGKLLPMTKFLEHSLGMPTADSQHG